MTFFFVQNKFEFAQLKNAQKNENIVFAFPFTQKLQGNTRQSVYTFGENGAVLLK